MTTESFKKDIASMNRYEGYSFILDMFHKGETNELQMTPLLTAIKELPYEN